MKREASFSQHIIVAGLVRNAGLGLVREIRALGSVFSSFSSVTWVIVESDSNDNTAALLEKFSFDIPNFNYISLGRLEERLPNRIARIAHCRNVYLDFLKNRLDIKPNTWLSIVDLDGLNKKLDASQIGNILDSEIGDAYFANQSGPYYDLAALRHEVWNPGDCHNEMEKLVDSGMPRGVALDLTIFRRMIRIPPGASPIRVQSAFGGLGFYRCSLIGEARYSSLTPNGKTVCEHVAFNSTFGANSKLGLWIVPSLINAGYTEHTRLLAPGRRFLTPILRLLKFLALAGLGDESKIEAIYKKTRKMLPWL